MSRYLIVSLGSIGQRHFEILRELRPNSQFAVVRRPGRAMPEGVVGYRQFDSLEAAMVFEPDAAIVAGPATQHLAAARTLVTAGVPTLIEKPLSHNLAGVAELECLAKARNVPVMVGYNMRYHPAFMAIRQQLQENRLGDVLFARAEVGQYLPDWRPGADYRESVSARSALGGGALLELSHEIDSVYALWGLPQRVWCRGGKLSPLEIDVEDVVEICLEYAHPAKLVTIHLDFVRRTPLRAMTICGKLGTLVWNSALGQVTVDIAEPERHIVQIAIGPVERNFTYREELNAFLACAEHRSPVPIGLAAAIDVMAIVEAARCSMTSGQGEVPILRGHLA